MAGAMLVQQMPRHTCTISRSEDLNVRRRYGLVEQDTGEFFDGTTESRKAQSENLYEQRRRGYAEQDTSEAVLIEPIQYRFYKPEQFPRFQYIYNQIMDCKSRIEKAGIGRIQTHQMSQNVIIKIGTIGDFTDKKCNLISKRKGRKTTPNGTTIWEAQPLVCFSESLTDDLCLQRACHTILIKSGSLSDTDHTDDSIIIVGHNKEQIKNAITTCLEEPIHQMLQKWLEVLKNEPSNDTSSELIAEIEAIGKQMEFINRKYTTPNLNSNSLVPDDLKEYLFRIPGVHSFGIWGSSSFKIFVNKSDEKSLRDGLTKMNPTFFNNYKIEIENGKLQDKLTYLMQGDEIQAKIPNDDQKCHTGTLGGIVTKANDKSRKFALTCNHLFPKVGERAYNENLEDIGACLFTTDKNSCDFAAIEIEKSFSEKCDETFQNEDRKIINARVFSESLTNVGIVHKIGAATKVTKGRVLSSEYYDKLFDDNNREHVFLVKGIPGNFSKEGDSGSLVFTRSKDAQQTCVDVLGMVYGNKVTVYDDYDDDVERKSKNKDDNESSNTSPSSKSDNAASNVNESDNISSCYRIHTALELFKQN